MDSHLAWTNDTDPQEQHTSGLYIDLYVDTIKLLAMFRLHATILLRPLGKWATLYLLVHPERIQSIEFNLRGDDLVPLHFTMTQAPTFVVPKEMQESYELRPQDQDHFDSIKSLARLRQFTVYLDPVDLKPETMVALCDI
ncbi:hypothetical protein QBC32DRAFT_349036 [Pseudoneurospora amorphoporcata]|uniref:Uncharacterized protein n=1 Tax=Pseudoneurospora amorphoporcata TaxID=241081 RepID=A0AAN6NP71_9PEZI|nr:hypothetical protein QBC32DRAFT_349036 [Pseudoneurospora amorphoporcata]